MPQLAVLLVLISLLAATSRISSLRCHCSITYESENGVMVGPFTSSLQFEAYYAAIQHESRQLHPGTAGWPRECIYAQVRRDFDRWFPSCDNGSCIIDRNDAEWKKQELHMFRQNVHDDLRAPEANVAVCGEYFLEPFSAHLHGCLIEPVGLPTVSPRRAELRKEAGLPPPMAPITVKSFTYNSTADLS